MDSEPASGVRLVAVRRVQCHLNEMALPDSDRLMEWKSRCCLDIERALCCGLGFAQFPLYLVGSDGPSTGLDGGTFDQMLQFPHVAGERIALQDGYRVGSESCQGSPI